MPTQDEDHANCDWCGNEELRDDLDHVDGSAVCAACHESYVEECDDCGDMQHRDDTVDVGTWRRDRRICETCYDGEYFYCEGCDEHMSVDMYGSDMYCSDCTGDDEDYCDCGECGYSGRGEGIRPWGDAPDLRFNDIPFIGPLQSLYMRQHAPNYSPMVGKYYLGMEIEVEETDAHTIGEFVSAHPDFMWASTDATLDNGYEIITHPTTYASWMQQFPWAEWERDLHNNVPDQAAYNSNGIHIHVSRTAFADAKGTPKASHLYKFMQFIRINEGAIQMLSGRTSSSYCEWDQHRDARDGMADAKTATSTRNYERYRPINTQNRATVELRFFDGRTDPTFMKRALGFTTSVVEFTRHGKAHDPRTWEAYVEYVSEHAELYPDLNTYLMANKRRLVFNAMTSDFKYSDKVLPDIRVRKERERRQNREAQEVRARELIEREQLMANPAACTCSSCVAYADRLARGDV